MPEPAVSVILPLFGDHGAVADLPAVCRAWFGQDLPCEIVVGIAPGTVVPPLPPGPVRLVAAPPGTTSPGILRNVAVAASRAPLLYLGDADIAPLGPDYLSRAVAVSAGRVLIQPWMYRLVNPAALLDSAAGPLPPPPRGRFCHVTLGPNGLTRTGPEQFRWLNPEIAVVTPPPGHGWRNADGSAWQAFPFHWGGFLLPRGVFDAAGGYCARYLGWGCEDDDLIAKLESRGEVLRAWRVAKTLTCLHLEHPRTSENNGLKANQAILHERLAAGGAAMIAEDLRLAS
ncbi:galactosyltransferase-related protein [Dactylosporangium sp. CA-233914]|uniref:galactosyltransferase-related protein n=1 Tax=Dactylosporangium sp. CA-233914 TaxID=3239934 RepID=UPI003D8B873E